MSEDNEKSAEVIPTRSATALRALGSLARFQPDHVVPVRLVQQLHDHVVTEWGAMLGTLETFKLVVIDGERVYLTEKGAETARKLSGSVGCAPAEDPALEVLLASNHPCFARSFDADNEVCAGCSVRSLCQWNLPSHLSEQAFKLQLADDTERERLAAEAEARRRMEQIEEQRRQREEARKNVPNLRTMVDRLWGRAAAEGNPEAIRRAEARKT